MQHRPEEIARYTVEQNGGEYTTDVPDLLSLFGRQQLTDQGRGEVRSALQREGVGTDPDLLVAQRSDVVRLFLLESQRIAAAPDRAESRGSTTPRVWRGRLRPRTWKGWVAYGFAALLILAVLAGDSDETREATPAGEGRGTQEPPGTRSDRAAAERREREALRRKREELRKQQTRLRRERAQARRESARLRKAGAAARRERERQAQREELAAPPPPEPAPSCHPSYDPCLDANASDYDCEGGSGDGPMYTGFVTVKGPDDYGLDSDGDGTGCES